MHIGEDNLTSTLNNGLKITSTNDDTGDDEDEGFDDSFGNETKLSSVTFLVDSPSEQNDSNTLDCSTSSHVESSETPSENNEKLLKNSKDVLCLAAMALMYFFAACNVTVMSPFFPAEAAARGASGTVSGWIFAIYPLICFVLSPFAGKWLPVIGPRFCLFAGSFIEGVSQVLFGFVVDMPSNTQFIIFCFVIRSVTALGSAFTETATLAILSVRFPKHMSTVFGLLELFLGLGMTAGPAIGGVLYQAGGFRLPFLVTGGANLFVIFLAYFILSSSESRNSEGDDNNNEEKVGSVLNIIKIPGVFVMTIIIATSAMASSYLDPILSTYLQKITNNSLSTEEIGVVFLIAAGTYAVCAPIFGYFVGKKVNGRIAIIVGLFFTSIGFFMIGPLPLVQPYVKPSLWLVCVSMGLIGGAFAPFIVPTLDDMQLTSIDAGLPDNLATNSILSGLFSSFYSVGSVFGPVFAGFLTDNFSFAWACSIMSFIMLAEGFVLILFTIWEKKAKRYRRLNENTVYTIASVNA